MIEYNDKIKSMLLNILEKTSIILDNFETNKQCHRDYITEKMRGARWDMEVIMHLARPEMKEKCEWCGGTLIGNYIDNECLECGRETEFK